MTKIRTVVVDDEPMARERIVGLLNQEKDIEVVGEADAGFVYRTDVRAASGRLHAVSIPAWAQPSVRYQVAVVRASRSRAAARRYVGLLSTPRARRLLKDAGFTVP